MTDRLVLGAFDGTYVLRVSRPGYDVLDPNLPKEALAFDSRFVTNMTILQSGVLRGQLFWMDMAGWLWVCPTRITMPTEWLTTDLPMMVVSPRPEFSDDYIAEGVQGDVFYGAGYQESNRTMGIQAQASWAPSSGGTTARDFGWYYYWLLRA